MYDEELPLKEAEFTYEEALEYFYEVFKDTAATILDWDWNWYVVEEWLDEPKHREVCLDLQFIIGEEHRIYVFSVWMEPNGLYGEW
jgi:hypothetical protein